ncbi:MAG: tRNA (guanosine(37)-N1)-methyltransferase TrmD [Christensenellales bacterium]|nr:tRNA (guanosine(37)-N1)-methyltransferase TrmD [Christensenellales bacterium]
MKIDVLTLFPEMLRPVLGESILGRAIDAGYLSVNLTNLRDYARNKHRNTDDYPFGGGAGMVMYAQPIVDAVDACDPLHRARRIYLSPRGRTLTQSVVEELAQEEHLLLLCGHYEGVDQRALDLAIDEELSIGDYVLTGGELGALVVIDSVARLVPGVLGSSASGEDESFSTGLLEYPQYTRPADFRGQSVPPVLLGGHHAEITAWRREQSLEITLERRPELLRTAPLDDEDRSLLRRLQIASAVIHQLRSCGVTASRESFGEASAFPKRWFEAFVPEFSRKDAKKQCFSGRRHVGWLWQAFSMAFAPCCSGQDAISQRDKALEQCRLLFLPDDGLLFRLQTPPTGAALSGFPHYLLCDEALSFTFAQPHKPGIGPYFRRLES